MKGVINLILQGIKVELAFLKAKDLNLDYTVKQRDWENKITQLVNKAKSRKYQGVFEVKSRVKTWQVRGIWSQKLEH